MQGDLPGTPGRSQRPCQLRRVPGGTQATVPEPLGGGFQQARAAAGQFYFHLVPVRQGGGFAHRPRRDVIGRYLRQRSARAIQRQLQMPSLVAATAAPSK